MTNYRHRKRDIAEACGITKERLVELYEQLGRVTQESAKKLNRGLTVSEHIEAVERLVNGGDWSAAEAVFVAYAKGRQDGLRPGFVMMGPFSAPPKEGPYA